MKFYIFADDNDVINTTPKGSKYISDDYSDATDEFLRLCREYAYSNIYLIVDFEYKHSGMFGYDSWENLRSNIIVPFLIIRDFHFNKSTMECNAIDDEDGKFNEKLTIRHDSITIETQGFIQEFNENTAALDKFLYCIYNRIPATMNLLFVEELRSNMDDSVTAEYKRKIASSIEVIRNKKTPLKRIKLDRNLVIYKYKFPKRKFVSSGPIALNSFNFSLFIFSGKWRHIIYIY